MTPDPTTKADDEAFVDAVIDAIFGRNYGIVERQARAVFAVVDAARQSLAPPLPADRKELVEALIAETEEAQGTAYRHGQIGHEHRYRRLASELARLAAALEAASPHPQAVEAKEGE